MKKLTLGIGAGICAAAGIVYASFHSDMRQHARRLTDRSAIFSSPIGQVEYAIGGEGPPFLMIHGTGGGFDQALTFTEALAGYRVIAPSRFGYLRSAFPEDPSSERQADAFAQLLDHLGIARVPVAGGSAGALSAVQFALRYPERTSALILVVPAANVSGRDPVEMSAATQFMVQRLARSDFLFWSATRAARGRMVETLLATDSERVEQASESERKRARRILGEILPVSRRWQGMLNDAQLAGHPARVDFSKIAVPTLVISVEDDRFGTAATARAIAAAVPGAELLMFRQGGHIWLGHDQDLWRAVAEFVDRKANERVRVSPPDQARTGMSRD